MKEVQFSHREGDYLILKDENGEQLRLELNTVLRQAVRNQTADSAQFSPGEVQAHIRSGLSLDEVAAKLGVDGDEIEPFAAPVMQSWTISNPPPFPFWLWLRISMRR